MAIDSSKDEITDELTFYSACAQGNLNVVKFCFTQQGFDMNVSEFGGSTGFHLACLCGKLNVVQFFLQQGFDINVGDDDGLTGFHDACSEGYLNIVQFLLQQGFDMNVGDNNGTTGFHYACQGNLNVVEFLLQQGFDINVDDDNGRTGFHWACFDGNLNIVQFLVQQGFEGINEIDFYGITGLGILIRERDNFCNNELFMPCVLLLIEAGAQYENDVFEELISGIQNRIIEITFMKEIIFQKWTGRIAQAITDFAMEPFTNTSLQNLLPFLG